MFWCICLLIFVVRVHGCYAIFMGVFVSRVLVVNRWQCFGVRVCGCYASFTGVAVMLDLSVCCVYDGFVIVCDQFYLLSMKSVRKHVCVVYFVRVFKGCLCCF